MSARTLHLLLLLLCLPLGGCSLLGLGPNVKARHASASPPSDITAYVSVVDGNEPVSYLDASNFQVSENGVVLNSDDVGLRLLSRDSIAAGLTVLLLDVSGDPDKKLLARIERGATAFITKVTTTQSVIVLAFDGSERPREVARFGRVESETKRALPPLQPFLSGDNSRDLHGAVLSAIAGLEKGLKAEKKEILYGTIVTMTRGPDLAGRKTLDELESVIDESKFDFFSLSPTDRDVEGLNVFGRDLVFEFETVDTLPMRFQDAGMRVRNGWFSNYLITYCSPARAGSRELDILVDFEGVQGGRQSGSDTVHFDASQFKAGCKTKVAEPLVSRDEPDSASTPSEQVVEPDAEEKKPVTRLRRPKSIKAPQPAESNGREIDEPKDDGPIVAPPSSGKYE